MVATKKAVGTSKAEPQPDSDALREAELQTSDEQIAISRQYLRVGQLAKILGWSRPNTYYWVYKLKIPMVEIASLQFISVDRNLPEIIMTMQQAKREAHETKTFTE